MGTWTSGISRCATGVLEGFNGPEFYLDGITIRAFKDAVRGSVILIQRGSDPRVELTREDCSTLDFIVNWSEVLGTLTFACSPMSGGMLRGKVRFRCADLARSR